MAHKKITAISIISLAALLSFTAVGQAELDVGNYTISGSAEVGGLPQNHVGHKAKFEEYRDLPESVIVPSLELKVDSKKNDYYLEWEATKPGRDDQNFRMRLGKYGLLDVEVEWDQIPHFFNGDTAATPFVSHDGIFSLRSKRNAAGNCPSDGTVRGWVNTCSHGIDLSLLQGFARFKLRYTPSPGWTFSAGYVSQSTNGDRAFGTVTNGFTNIVELPEPINYITHNIELGGEYAASWWTLGLKYNASLFHNYDSTLMWDNPFSSSAGLGAACVDAPNSTCRARLDLYPSNQAHNFTLTGTAKLPFMTSFLGTVSHGLRLQDDKFLPFTSNRCFGTDPAACSAALITPPRLLRSSLDGEVRPTMVNVTLVNRYFRHLDLKAYYRYYDFDNRSKRLFLPDGYIRSDTGPAASAAADGLRSFPYAHAKQNLGLDAGYEFAKWLSGKFSYGLERVHRNRREVLNANEHSFGPTLDIKPAAWFLFRASYRRYLRDAHEYNAGREVIYETTDDVGDIIANRLLELRKLDEAARERDKVSLFAQISPWEMLTLHGGFDFINDDYPRTEIGTQKDVNYSPSVGFVYAPLMWASFFGDYNWERFDWRLKNMERNNAAQSPETDCPDSTGRSRCWTSRGTDRIHTFSLGTDLKLIEKILGLRLQYGLSIGESLVHASGSTCASCTRATDYPSITNRWHELLARFEYALHKNVDLKFGYYFNRFSSKDVGVDIMKLWMGDVDTGTANSIFLGDRLKGPYEAHVGFMAVKLKF